jgi:hypothetical protein
MYGFHKVPHLQQGVLQADKDSEIWEFSNAHFLRNQPDLLYLLTRKKHKEPEEGDGGSLDASQFNAHITAIKQHQHRLSSELQAIQKEQKLLWNETASFNEKFNRQQDTIEKILRFLASVYVNKERDEKSIIPKKRRLLLEEGVHGSVNSMPQQQLPNSQVYRGNNDFYNQVSQNAPQLTVPTTATNNYGMSNLEPLSSRISDAGKLFLDINDNIDSLNLNRETLASVLGLDPSSSMENLDVNELFQFSDDQRSQDNSFAIPSLNTAPYFLTNEPSPKNPSPQSSISSTTQAPSSNISPISPPQHVVSTQSLSPSVDILPSPSSIKSGNSMKLSSFVEDEDDIGDFPSLDTDYGDILHPASP